jgi:small conductance mechanosensitive channel
VDRIGERIIRAREKQGIDPAELNELRKRLSTVEDLVSKLLRAAVLFVIVVVLLTLLDLVSVVVALGVVFAGLAIAGQSIVLDYLMGILILVEGQFYVGDWVSIATNNVVVSGTVEEIGLRRTILRDVSGTVHSVSNGEVRVSSNLTRVYAVLQVEIPVVPEVDIEQAIAITNRVGAEMYADPDWSTRLLEAPAYASIPAVSDLGVTLRAAGRVQGADRFAAASELRRRLLIAFAAEGIAVAQRLRPPAP